MSLDRGLVGPKPSDYGDEHRGEHRSESGGHRGERGREGIEAVVSLLDLEHDEKVRKIWAALEREFGLCNIYSAPFPHFSYHGANDFDDAGVQTLLERVARKSHPFHVRTSGLGIFPGSKPVLYVPVVRSPKLIQYHCALYGDLSDLALKPNPYYHPERWLPHMTLAHGDLTPELLPEVVRFLNEQTFNWTITIDNFSLVYTEGVDQGLSFRVEL